MKSLFTLDWFRSKKQKELEALRLEEQKLKNELLKKDLSLWDQPDIPIVQERLQQEKPYLTIKFVNNVLTVVLRDGNILSKTDAKREDFEKVRDIQDEEEILSFMTCQEVKKEEEEKEQEFKEAQKVVEGFNTLKNINDFEVVGNIVYMKGTGRSLPPLLVEKFAEVIEEQKYYTGFGEDLKSNIEYLALKRFFLWCCLNPRAEVADKLYTFLVQNSFRITKQGFFVALRNVVSVESGDKGLVEFVSNAYNKIKAVWKKNPDDYFIYSRLGDFKILKKDANLPTDENPYWTFVGVLKDLYLDLPNMKENRFTDDYTKTFDIRIGKVVSMPSEECSWSTKDCAKAGLHFTANEINYVGCGDTSVLILINPMKVVGIGDRKGRCYEYLPIMTVPREESTRILSDLDFDTLELDEDFAIKELESLSEKVKEGFAKESKKYEFNLPSISSSQLSAIVASLDEMRDTLSKRVQTVE